MEDKTIILESQAETELRIANGFFFITQQGECDDDMVTISRGQAPAIIRELKAWLKQLKAEK